MVPPDMNIPLIFIENLKGKKNFHFYVQIYHKNEKVIKIKTLVLLFSESTC